MGPPTILIVDDEPDVLESLSDLVHEFLPTAVVQTAAGGAAALDILKATRIDLIITDYRMPEMDGLEFLEQVRKLKATVPAILVSEQVSRLKGPIPAVMVSAFVDPRWEARAINELGVKCLLRKPIDLGLFEAVLKTILGAAPAPDQ